MKDYKSLKEALSDLTKEGYKDDFKTDSFGLYCGDLDMRLDPEEFHVDETDRVKADADPKDDTVVYAISSVSGEKGIIVDDPAAGKNSDNP